MGQGGLGVPNILCKQLASANVDFAHAGLPMVRLEADGASFDESTAAHGEHGFAVFGVKTINWWFVAERGCCGAVCVASIARGVGGVDRGAEGCAECVLVFGDRVGLCKVLGGNSGE